MTLNVQIQAGMVNVGSKENPMWIPKEALSTEKAVVDRFWGMVAAGGIMLSNEQQDYLLESEGE